jgi:FkbM family methyltransferase
MKEVPWHIGKHVERTGCIVRLDNCQLDVNSDVFSTFHRGCIWLHRHEEPERIAVGRFLNPALPVIELGASTGALSCLINRRLHFPEAHIAVEANPALIPVLDRNRLLNSCRFTIIHAAVADSTRPVGFSPGYDHLAGRVNGAPNPESAVKVVTLGTLLNCVPGNRVTLVCDIEGMEVDLWRRDRDTIVEPRGMAPC